VRHPPLSSALKGIATALTASLLLASTACGNTNTTGYNSARGYDAATLKLVSSAPAGSCVNRFTYDSDLAPSRNPQVVPCDSPAARIRNDGSHTTGPGCIRLDYEFIDRGHHKYFCLKYLVRVGYCYPGVTPPHEATKVLLYAPSSCDQFRRLPQVATNLIPDVGADAPPDQFTNYVVTDIQSPANGKHCPSLSVDLEPPEQITGPGSPPAISQLICLARR
jgi:hypothetical protein